jgi:hypothetical protein
MQYGNHTGFYMTLRSEQAERFPGRPEQDAVCFTGMMQTQRIEFVRQSKDHMEVRDGKQFRTSRLYPFFTLLSLAFGTVTVAAGKANPAKSCV